MKTGDSQPTIWNGLHDNNLGLEDADVLIMGLPFDKATSFRQGAAEAPDRIRLVSSHISPTTEDGESLAGIKVLDIGNLEPDNLSQEEYFTRAEEKATELFKISFPTFIGGDHSVSIPLIKAAHNVYGKELGVIHLDAHSDLCEKLDGNRLSHGCTHRRVIEGNGVSLGNICFAGIRSFEQQELDFLDGHQANIITASEMSRTSMEKTAETIKTRLKHCKAFYLTLDIDFLDPATAPGTGTPKPGGFTSRDLFTLIKELSDLKFIGIDVVEVSPPLDQNDITSFAAQRAITEAWGYFL
ncbi:MAG: agmatinase [Bacteroidales bacterium]